MKNLKIRLKLFIMILIPLVTVIFTAVDGVVEINNTYNTLTDAYYEKLYKVNELILNADRDIYQALDAQKTLSDAGTTEISKTDIQKDLEDNINQANDRVKEAVDILVPIKDSLVDIKHSDVNKTYLSFMKIFRRTILLG